MNTHVDFETAKLLKEKGYRLIPEFESSYPTIAEVVMWLHEKHRIWIVILPELLNGTEIRYYPSVFEQGVGEDIESYFNTPTEAYQEAIKHTLENLI